MSDVTSTPPDVQAERKRLLSELVSLCDDFAKFSEECAFLCDGLAAVTKEPECIVPDTSEGIRHMSYWLKCEARGYRERIEELHAYLYQQVHGAWDGTPLA
ncbi:hypothetical protein SG34_014155 [Thalassomonas viridans]|uniref:Uncharacterized protein n=1 Tax=Thalassomonas viridans TaxID=137584 RepID=A0AAE9Z8E2_9GAMM|nr:hypothetical protein [Thalassomonas viridans]WDE07924.1 hypothetical protein SG34_014155 [Thalassomonas viridans]